MICSLYLKVCDLFINFISQSSGFLESLDFWRATVKTMGISEVVMSSFSQWDSHAPVGARGRILCFKVMCYYDKLIIDGLGIVNFEFFDWLD